MFRNVIKVISSALIFGILSTSTVFASDISCPKKHATISELDLCKETDSQNDISIDDNRSMVRNYINRIDTLASQDDQSLRNEGYSDKSIYSLKLSKTFIDDNKNDYAKIASSSLIEDYSPKLQTTIELSGHNNDTSVNIDSGNFKTLIHTLFSWQWSEKPIFQNVDAFGISFNSNTNLNIYSTDTAVSYKSNQPNTVSTNRIYGDGLTIENNTLYTNFITSRDFDGINKSALSGYSYATLVSRSRYLDSFDISLIYGHALDSTFPLFKTSNNGLYLSDNNKFNTAVSTTSAHFELK